MNLAYVLGAILAACVVAAICYGVYWAYTEFREMQREKEELVQDLADLRAEDSDIDSDSDSEDFQDLRHHRLAPHMMTPHPPIGYTAQEEYPVQGGHVNPVQLDTQSLPPPPTHQEEAQPSSTFRFNTPEPPDMEEWNDIRTFYTATLPVTLTDLSVRNCVECELLDAVIPRGDYVIHTRNQTFQVRQPFEASVQTFTDITIPVGDYSASTLATAITNLVVAAGLASFSATTSTLTKNFTFFDDSVIDVSFNQELAYDLGWGTTTNLNLGSVQYTVNASDSYVINSSNNTFEVSVSGGAYVEYTIPSATYTASTLATAMDTAITSPAGLTVAYVSDSPPSIAIYHTTGNALTVRLGTNLASLLSGSTLTSSVYDTDVSKYYASSTRVDLYGSRYVEIRTDELNSQTLHHRGVLQAAFLANEITNWRANGGDALRRRRFPTPITIDKLTLSFKERHPSRTLENEFYNMELNGLAVSFTICFRRKRYKNEAAVPTLSMQ